MPRVMQFLKDFAFGVEQSFFVADAPPKIERLEDAREPVVLCPRPELRPGQGAKLNAVDETALDVLVRVSLLRITCHAQKKNSE
jgi:hypothetical protein